MLDLTKTQIVFAVLLIPVAAAAAFANVFFTGFTCAWDTSSCAESSKKNGVYEGFLRGIDGEPYRSSTFTVEFGSRGSDDELAFETDENGHYCIRWAEEDYAVVRSPTELSTSEGDSHLGSWRDLNGDDPPPGCQEGSEGIPWTAAKDAESSWQYWLLIVLPAAAIAALLAALIGRQTSYGLPLFTAGCLLLGVDVLAFFVLRGLF